MSKKKDQVLRILAVLDGHFTADDISPAGADRWRELKQHITRMKDGLDLARIELESLERGAPQTKEILGKALQHAVWAWRENRLAQWGRRDMPNDKRLKLSAEPDSFGFFYGWAERGVEPSAWMFCPGAFMARRHQARGAKAQPESVDLVP